MVAVAELTTYPIPKTEIGYEETISNTNIFPWSERTPSEWKRFVKKEEAARLFYLAQSKDSDIYNRSSLEWIKNWQLNSAFEAFWGNNLEALNASVSEIDKFHNKFPLATTSSTPVQPVLQIFSQNPQLFLYLRSASKLYAQKSENAQQEAAVRLGLNPEDKNLMQENYQQLTELFWPTVTKIARWQARRQGGDYEEYQGIAGVIVAKCVLNFYWEALVIDPAWTTARFISMLEASFKEASNNSNTFDTRTLEIPAELNSLPHADGTEDTALNKMRAVELAALLCSVCETDKERRILALKLARYTHKEIGNKLKIPKSQISRALSQIRQRLRDLRKTGQIDFEIPEKKAINGSPRWNRIFRNVQNYRKIFESKRKMVMPPYPKKILEIFLLVQTGERETTIDAVWKTMQAKGYNVKRSSIRRHITHAISFLTKEEDLGRQNPEKRWQRLQDAQIFMGIYNTPYWTVYFNEIQRKILQRYFIDWLKNPEQEITGRQIARDLEIHESKVSRVLDRCRRMISQNSTPPINIQAKARHNLPR